MMRSVIRLTAAVALLAGLAAFAPPQSGSNGVLPTNLCAQTGTCKYSYYDICFVNGRPFYDRRWVPAGGEIEVKQQ